MRDVLEKYLHAPRNGDGGGGGNQQQQQQQQQPAAWKAPDRLPAHLNADSAAGVVDKLLDAYLPARDQLSKMPKAPDKADAYALTLDGGLAGYNDTLKTDPMMPKIRELAHKHGMSADMYQAFVAGAFNIMHDMGAFAPLPTDEKVAEGLIDTTLTGRARGEAMTAATKRLTDARAFVDGLKDGADGGFSAHARAELAMMANSAGGVELIERLQGQGNQSTVRPGGQSDPVANLQAEYEERLKDPKNQTDTAFAAETREMSKRIASARRTAQG